MLTQELSNGASGWIALGSIEQLPAGQGRCFRFGGRSIAIFRNRAGDLFAVDSVCPHRQGPLADGLLGGNTIICPLHGYKFSLTDGRGLDNNLSIARHEATERDGIIFLRLCVDDEVRVDGV